MTWTRPKVTKFGYLLALICQDVAISGNLLEYSHQVAKNGNGIDIAKVGNFWHVKKLPFLATWWNAPTKLPKMVTSRHTKSCLSRSCHFWQFGDNIHQVAKNGNFWTYQKLPQMAPKHASIWSYEPLKSTMFHEFGLRG